MALSQSSKILVSDINSALAGKQDALGYTPVKSVNGTSADSSGNVTVSATPSSVKGVLGSAWAVNGTSMTLPSGGTWFVFNVGGYFIDTGSGDWGIQKNGVSNNYNVAKSFIAYGSTYSGGTTVYARVDMDGERSDTVTQGKLAAIRIA